MPQGSALALGLTLSLIAILTAYGPAEVIRKPGTGFVCVEAEFTCCRSPGTGMQRREDRDEGTGSSSLCPAVGSFCDRGHSVNASELGLKSG